MVTVQLQPGGVHLMLLAPVHALRKGGRVPLTLQLERGGTVAADLLVEAPGARAITQGVLNVAASRLLAALVIGMPLTFGAAAPHDILQRSAPAPTRVGFGGLRFRFRLLVDLAAHLRRYGLQALFVGGVLVAITLFATVTVLAIRRFLLDDPMVTIAGPLIAMIGVLAFMAFRKR